MSLVEASRDAGWVTDESAMAEKQGEIFEQVVDEASRIRRLSCASMTARIVRPAWGRSQLPVWGEGPTISRPNLS